MADPFYAEIRLFSFPYAPRGWAACDGALLPVAQNPALYSLIGNTYGGNASYLQLPDMRGKLAIHDHNHMGQVLNGEYSHTLVPNEVPSHTHQMYASYRTDNTGPSPTNTQFASGVQIYAISKTPNKVQLNARAVTGAGGTAHENRQPYTVVNFCIAVQGMYPSKP